MTRSMWRPSCLLLSSPCLSLTLFCLNILPSIICVTPSPLPFFLTQSAVHLTAISPSLPLVALSLFSIHTFLFVSLASSLLSLIPIHASRSLLSAIMEVNGKWTERCPTRLTPATLHCANNSGATRNAYMSCTRLLCCQLTAPAADRQEQESKTLLILLHSQHTRKWTDKTAGIEESSWEEA